MAPAFSPRYFLASVILLAALVTVATISLARRTQQELARQLEETGAALARTIEASSRQAIRGNALMEEMIGQRLLDNARLLDELLRYRPPDPDWLRSIAAMNHLRRIDLLGRDGRPYAWPAPPPRGGMMMGMRRMMGKPAPGEPPPPHHRAMMMYLWGPRWGPPRDAAGVPPPLQDRHYWEGSVFGVAVGARSFPGIIAVHADAAYVLNFSREIGIQRQVEELGSRAGVESIAILGPDLTVVAHSDPASIGQRLTDDALAGLAERGGTLTRRATGGGALEITRPLALDGARTGLLQVRLSTAPMEAAWRRDRTTTLVVVLAVLGLGALGLATIFFVQHRQLAQVTALEAEVARRRRLSMLGDLSAGVGHEIRNPLNAVSMGLQRLRAEFAPAGDREEYDRVIELVSGEVRRLNALVDEFLSLARPPVLKPEPVAVPALVDEVVRLIGEEAGRSGVRIEQLVPDDLPPLVADRDRLEQVLLNLARNAIDAMPDGGTLRIEARVTPRTLTLAVTDSGGGIPPEIRARIFEPYFTTKTRGLGLGLAISRQIVEAHGGALDVEAAAGGGACFRVHLPWRPREA
jgi:two-component system sensor histidine kinase HydH